MVLDKNNIVWYSSYRKKFIINAQRSFFLMIFGINPLTFTIYQLPICMVIHSS